MSERPLNGDGLSLIPLGFGRELQQVAKSFPAERTYRIADCDSETTGPEATRLPAIPSRWDALRAAKRGLLFVVHLCRQNDLIEAEAVRMNTHLNAPTPEIHPDSRSG